MARLPENYFPEQSFLVGYLMSVFEEARRKQTLSIISVTMIEEGGVPAGVQLRVEGGPLVNVRVDCYER